MQSITVSTYLSEGVIAARLAQIQVEFSEVEIGSYPFVRDGKLGTSLVARHEDTQPLARVQIALTEMIKSFGGVIAGDN